MAQQLPPTKQQSTPQLLRRIVNGMNGLVDRHVQLVKQELKEELWEVIGASKTLGIGIGVAVVGALIALNVLVMIIVLGLNQVGEWLLPGVGRFLGWLVVVLLIAVVFLVAYRLVMRGIREVQISPVARTREILREDKTWAKQLLTRNGK